MAAWAIRVTSRSSTSIVITAATASPKAARKSRSGKSRDSCSAIWEPESTEEDVNGRRLHLRTYPLSPQRQATDRSRLPLYLVSTRNRYGACVECALRGGQGRAP